MTSRIPRYCLKAGLTLCTYLYSQSKFRHVSVAATTVIREGDTTDRKTLLFEGHEHITIFRVSPSTQLFMSHLPHMYLAGWIVYKNVKFRKLEIIPELTACNRSQPSTSFSLLKTIATHKKRPPMQFMQEKMGCGKTDFFQVCHHAFKTFVQNRETYEYL